MRSENEINISEIAILSKLLTECVQCYGTSLKSSKIERYYRGVGNVFKFEMFITQFNLPTSTSTMHRIAVSKFTNGGNGLVLELRAYKKEKYDVFKFDCAALSAFPEEAEVLFYGGNTVLRIATIQQVVGLKWLNYRKYIKPMNIILRLINALPIKGESILTNQKQQKTMGELINHILPIVALNDGSNLTMNKLPTYIHNLLLYHVSNPAIKLNYIELMNEYSWMENVFIKRELNQNNQKKLPNVQVKENLCISKICILFSRSDEIFFYMPNNYNFTEYEYKSLIEELELISTMNVNVMLHFKWSTKMPTTNNSIINNFKYVQQLLKLNWTRRVSVNCVSFEYVGLREYTYYGQTLIQSFVQPMIHHQNAEEVPNVQVQENTKSGLQKPISNIVRTVQYSKQHFSIKMILVVEWYGRTQTELFIPQDIIGLIIFFAFWPQPIGNNHLLMGQGKAKAIPNINNIQSAIERGIKHNRKIEKSR
eukprot:545569_1